MNDQLNYISCNVNIQKNYSLIFSKILQLQTAQQNFLIKKDNSYYEEFTQINAQINNLIQNINNISAKDQELRPQLHELIRAINSHNNFLKENLDITKNFNIDSQDNILAQEAQFSNIIEKFIEKENNNLQLHNQYISNIRYAFLISLLIFLLALTIFTVIIAENYGKDVEQVKQEQYQLNQENLLLETKILERTKDLENARIYAEKERHRVELLLQDTSHRIGNSLATVASLLGMQAARSNNEQVKQALNSARDRIQTIAAAHRRLRLGNDMETTMVNEFLQAVIHDIECSLPADLIERVTISSQLQPYSFCSRDATTLGIVMGELLTNAIKHAFPAPNYGKIHVFFGKKAPDYKLCLIIEDNGTGFDTIKTIHATNCKHQAGLGMLVAKQLCLQFNCEPIYQRAESGGTRVTINLDSVENREIKISDPNIAENVA